MAVDIDEGFYKRADAFIDLANDQCGGAAFEKVSASLMYASARFNAWASATEFSTDDQMREAKLNRIAYFVAQYRTMLEENMDSYIKNFNDYMKPAG